MKVLVIGGTVFIGRAVVNELVEAGHDVCVVHRGEHEPEDLAPVAHIHVDRANLASKRAEIDAFEPEAVWDNFAMFRVHAQGVLDALGRDRRYVVTSSMDVYRAYGGLHTGKTTDAVPVDETSPVRPERYPYRGQFPGMDDYDKLPDDLGLTGAVPQHLLVDSSKARRALGWSDTDAAEALGVSVAWHLAHPPSESSEDFAADDEALASAAD